MPVQFDHASPSSATRFHRCLSVIIAANLQSQTPATGLWITQVIAISLWQDIVTSLRSIARPGGVMLVPAL